jgi:hypothetical protein
MGLAGTNQRHADSTETNHPATFWGLQAQEDAVSFFTVFKNDNDIFRIAV